MSKPYSDELYKACLEFLLHKNQNYATAGYHSRYIDLLMLVMKHKGSLNEKLCQEYRDAEEMVKRIRSTPVYKVMEDE